MPKSFFFVSDPHFESRCNNRLHVIENGLTTGSCCLHQRFRRIISCSVLALHSPVESIAKQWKKERYVKFQSNQLRTISMGLQLRAST